MSQHRGSKMNVKTVFVTVGTTKFEELCETVITPDILDVFKTLGFNRIVIQIGNSQHDPGNFVFNGVSISTYRFKDSIAGDIASADLVVSHAGAGTCLEVLDLGKPLLVVINTELMDNHQVEIAEQLHVGGHLHYCTCDTLHQTLQDADFSTLKPYPKADTTMFYSYLNRFLGLKKVI